MSIPGSTPYYLLAHKREDGLIDYALLNPRGWTLDELVHTSFVAARDEKQMLERVEHLVPPWQDGITWRWVSLEELAKVIEQHRKPEK